MAYTIGIHLQVIAAQYEQVRVVPLTDTTAVLVYKDGAQTTSNSTPKPIKAKVATLDGLDITLGPEYNLSTSWFSCVNMDACKVANDKFLVAVYAITSSNPFKGYLGVVSVSGTTLIPGILGPNLYTYGLGVPRLAFLSTDKAILGDGLGGASRLRVVSIAGTTPTAGPLATVNSNNSDQIDLTVLTPSLVAIIARQTRWNSNVQFVSAATIAGTTVTPGGKVQWEVANLGVENTAIGKLDATHAGIFYRDNNNSNYGTTKVVTVTGNSVSLGAKEVFASGTIDNPIAVTNPQQSGLVAGYLNVSNQGIIRDAARSGNNISWDEEVVLHNGATSYLSIGHLTDTVSIGMYTDTSDADVKVVAFSTGGPTLTETIASGDMFIQGYADIDDNLPLLVNSHILESTSGDLLILGPNIGTEDTTINVFINGVEPKPALLCPILDPTASIQIKDSLIRIYQSRIDALINQLGKNVALEFDPIMTPCPNCTFDRIRKRSTGIYIPGGPRPFMRGRKCPWCKGRGLLETPVTKCIQCLIKWNPEDAENFGISIGQKKGIVRFKTFLTEADDLIRTRTAVSNKDIEGQLELRVKLIQGPIPVGLRERRYCISFWELI